MFCRITLPLALSLYSLSAAATPTVLIHPGLWEVKNTLAEVSGLTENLQICIGEGTNLITQIDQAKGNCSHKEIKRQGDTVTLNATCTTKKTTVTLHGQFSGDFKTRYTGTINTTYNPPLKGISTATIQQHAQRLGPCAEGQKSGEIVSKTKTVEGLEGVDLKELKKRFSNKQN